MANTARRTLFPPSDPNSSGMLDVGDGQIVYWEQSGAPSGKPVIVLHGGPGAGLSTDHRRAFDPARYLITQFDQRGCGRSQPRVSGPDVALSANTTWHLVSDIEKLRRHLGIERWQVFGGSWGSTLALAYAQTHPERVTELVLRGVFAARQSEIDWFCQGHVARFHPEAWRRLLEPLAVEDWRHGTAAFLARYGELLADPDPLVRNGAAIAWATSEAMCLGIRYRADEVAVLEDPAEAYTTARIEHHYFAHNAWLDGEQLIAQASMTLQNIRTVIVQGRYDMVTPPITAVELARAMPGAELIMIDDAGHAFDEPGIVDALVRSTDAFAEHL
jgi:proline iminopeptidase